ncbi:hypothetical protein PRIPAC_87737 [Pristionchus pacificus]|uniref:Uncharacterized protein n=1 Tax=Pristionchus pacificus TaxID=54126 RepID=A0A2A6CYY0_PRIPA|nr:hypothetical protein PRIPAC_87737 [Pristionchus pacificus]|eukprot:PDM83267.1 hypothetical protein PRIPAC_34899 [Pristionchus pacificus]
MANTRAVDFIDGWTKKSGEIRDNGLRMMVTRTLEAIKSMNGTSVENIEFHRGMLKSDRETAQKFDTKIALDHDLQFFYAIGESIELTMETVIERIKHPAQNPTISQSVQDQKLPRIPTKQQVPVAKQMPRISHSPRIPAVPQMPNVPLVPQASPVPQIPLLPQTISPVLTAAPVLGFHGRKPGRPRKSVNPEQPAAASIPSQRQAPNPILQNLIRNARNRAAADQFAVKQEIMDDTMPVLDAHIAQVNRVIKNEVEDAAFPDSNAPSTSRVVSLSHSRIWNLIYF